MENIIGRQRSRAVLKADSAQKTIWGVSEDILKIETGLQALAKWRNFEFFLAPYAYLGDSFKVERIGSYGGTRYDVMPLLKNLLPVKLEIAGNYNTNIDLERNEKQLWLRIILELK